MKKLRLILKVVLIIIIFSQNIFSQTNYYIKENGDDSKDGISDSTAWRSPTKVNQTNFFVPGDKILFKRGSEWYNQYFNIQFSGTESNPITIGAYGSGNLPLISGVSSVNEVFVELNPMTAPNIWMADINNPGRLFFDNNSNSRIDSGEELLRGWDTKTAYDSNDTNLYNLGFNSYSLKDDCSQPMTKDRWIWGDEYIGTNITVIYPRVGHPEDIGPRLFLYSEDDPNGKILRSSNSQPNFDEYGNYYNNYYNFHIYNKHDIIIENLDLQGGATCLIIGSNSSEMPVTISYSTNVTIKNCKIGAYSPSGIEARRVENIKIIDNTFDSKYTMKYGLSQRNCNYYITNVSIADNPDIPHSYVFSGSDRGTSDAIELSRYAKDCIIDKNTIKNFSHAGVYLNGNTSATDLEISFNKISNNTITGEDVSYARGIGVNGTSKVHSNEFFNNLIKNTSIQSQIGGHNNFIHHNIFDNITQSDLRPKGYSNGIKVRNIQPGFVSTNNRFDNNLFINCESAGIAVSNAASLGVDSPFGGDTDVFVDFSPVINNYFRNNIIYNCGRVETDFAGINIQSYGYIDDESQHPSSVYNNTYKNNLVFNNSAFGTITKTIKYHGNRYTVSEFESLPVNILHGNTIGDNIAANPDFISANPNNENNYKLNFNSPVRNAGDWRVLVDENGEILTNFNNLDYYNTYFPSSAPDIGVEEVNPEVTGLINENCDKWLTADDTIIYAYPLPNTQNYTFKFTNSDFEFLEIISSEPSLDISEYYNYEFSNGGVFEPHRWYDVKIKKSTSSIYNGYGINCNIRAPRFTFLTSQDCIGTFDIGDTIHCYKYPNAITYIFKFTKGNDHRWIYRTNPEVQIPNESFFSGGDYQVKVRDINGPYGEICNIEINYQNPYFEKLDKFKNPIIVSPNPFKKSINIFNANDVQEIKIYNSIGRLVYIEKYTKGVIEINLENLINGIYFVQIYTKEGIDYRKIIKQD